MGANNQPTNTPQVVANFDDAFGQSTADNVISMQMSPNGHYLAIDGTRSDGEMLWIFNTFNLTLITRTRQCQRHILTLATRLLAASFLYRPILPLGPGTSPDWHPGLWIVDAATGAMTTIDIHMSSTFLVDAIVSPDGAQIIYSTSKGLRHGQRYLVGKY